MRTYYCLVALLILFSFPSFVVAQGWEKTFGGAPNHKGFYAQPTTDGGYILIASSENIIYPFFDDVKLIKTNAGGDTLWTRFFDDVDISIGRIVQQTKDGGFIVIATSKSTGGLLHLTKLKADGSVEWRKVVTSPWDTINIAMIDGHSIQQTADGGFIIAGQLTYVGGGTSDAVLIKTTASGTLSWGRRFEPSWLRYNTGTGVEQTADGGYILSGNTESTGFVIKTDDNGYEQWQKGFAEFSFTDIKLANNEPGYVLIGDRIPFWSNVGMGAYFIKLKESGDTLFTRFLGGRDTVSLRSIHKTNDSGYCIAGTLLTSHRSHDILLIKTNSKGDTVWTRTAGDVNEDFGSSALQMNDGNFIVAGTITVTGGKTRAYLMRTDKLGNVLTNVISGKIFGDKNGNCLTEADEKSLVNGAYWKVKLMPGEKLVVPDSTGNYRIAVDTGQYTVNVINNHPYWEAGCPSSAYTVSFTKFYDTVSGKNFGLVTKANCSLMKVDVATGIVRPCREVVHTIQYCNDGTADATNVYLEFSLDPALTLTKSVPAVTTQNGSLLRYTLGTVKAGQCGTIYVTTTVACTAVAASTVCVKAKIYPDSSCTPVSSAWDKSSVKVSGKCTGNGVVRFVILDTGKAGEGNMQGPSEYRIYADNALAQTNSFQLKGGDSLVVQMDACGKTVRLEADQRPGHPGYSRPRETVEGCTGCGVALRIVGMRTGVAPDDEDAPVEEECSVVRVSMDPNEKLVIPAGITASHYILGNDELEYRINFQNTGNDTAFLVVIRDTLNTAVLDLSSFTPGLGSHPYSYKLIGKGVVEWTFANILLPDSTTNEKFSHGFVKFKIRQMKGLSNGTTIMNKAAIYFDFNAPVITNAATVMVNDFVPHDGSDYHIQIVKEKTGSSAALIIAPQPLVTSAMIKVQSAAVNPGDQLILRVFDAAGRNVSTLVMTGGETELKRGLLVAGLYFIEIRKGSERIAFGKLVVQ